jgi:hypothetical protein
VPAAASANAVDLGLVAQNATEHDFNIAGTLGNLLPAFGAGRRITRVLATLPSPTRSVRAPGHSGFGALIRLQSGPGAFQPTIKATDP